MSEQSPYEKLGVSENSSFEEIQNAKQRLIKEYHDDSKELESVEMAYDAIIMDRLRLRQEGKIKVPDRIRFPELSAPESLPNLTSTTEKNTPPWLEKLLDTPSQQEILLSASIFLTLALLVAFATQDSSQLSLLLAAGFAVSIYLLNRKEQRFPRAILISLIGLLAGIALGAGLAALVISPGSGNFLNSDQLATLVTLSILWLISSFLR